AGKGMGALTTTRNIMPPSITHAAVAAGALLLAATGLARAREIHLQGATAFPEASYYAKNFEKFIDKVNAEGKGLVKIQYVGGPKSIPTFELANALRNGVVGLANNTMRFTAGVAPEGLVLNYTEADMAELRRNGTLDYLNKIFVEKGLYIFA